MQKIGSVVRLPVRETDFSTQLTSPRPIAGAPQTDDDCRALKAWAESLPLDQQPAAPQERIEQHLAFMAATLPSQAVDDESGRRRFAVYVTLLSGFSDEALKHMARTACQTLRWFPVPIQCLELARAYRAPAGEREATLRICHDFAQRAFQRWLANISEGQPIGDVPEQWLRIAVERGPLRRLTNGSFVSRALYHGPFKPVLSLVSA
jgi:hypothetical protein